MLHEHRIDHDDEQSSLQVCFSDTNSNSAGLTPSNIMIQTKVPKSLSEQHLIDSPSEFVQVTNFDDETRADPSELQHLVHSVTFQRLVAKVA